MKSLPRFLTVVTLVVTSFLVNTAFASPIIGGGITYRCLGGNDYLLKYTYYRDCSGSNAPASATINISSSCFGLSAITLPQISQSEISPLCPTALSTCQGGFEPGVEVYIYQDTLTLLPCADWTFNLQECCRISGNTNLSMGPHLLYVKATLDNLTGVCNSSPRFNSPIIPFVCDSVMHVSNFGAYDPDGDSLVYSLVSAKGISGNLISYSSGLSPTYPIATTTGSVLFDQNTGLMTYSPVSGQVCAIVVQVDEYRGGILIGTITRDIQVSTTPCSGNYAPYLSSPGAINVVGGSQIDSALIEVCVGNQLDFDLIFHDLDSSSNSLSVSSNISTILPGASLTSAGTNPITAAFTWSPGPQDTGVYHLVITVIDDNCPINIEQSFLVKIRVSLSTYAGPDMILCGDSVQLQGFGGTNFQWTPSTGLSNDTISNPMAFPNITTTYILTSNSQGICDTIDSLTITVVPNFTLSVSSDTTICNGATIQISVSANPPGSYSFLWSPSIYLSMDTISNPFATPASSTLYEVFVTSSLQCSKSASVTISVDPTIYNINPTIDDPILCSGDSTVLHANLSLSTCDQYSVSSISFNPITGTGTAISLADDALSAALNIGFDFNFYCTIYDQFYISSNGFISFGSSSSNGCCTGQVIPNPTLPNNLIAFAWEDLSPQTGTVEYFTVGTTPNQTLVMNFINVPHYGSSNLVTSQVVLYESSNIIEIHTTEMTTDGGSHTQGIENSTGTIALPVAGRNSSNWSIANDAVQFAPAVAQSYTITWWDQDSNVVGTTLDPTVFPDSSGSYTVSITNGTCTNTKYLSVQVSSVNISADTILIACVGDSAEIQTSFAPTGAAIYNSCGLNSGCVGSGGIVSSVVGTGTSTNGTTSYPAPFGNFYKNAKHQFLYTAADLISMGVTSGTITELGFFIDVINGTTLYKLFTIKIGCVTITDLTTWQLGLDQVFTPKNITINTGLNNFTLDTPYNWDGVSSLIVEICYDNRTDPSYTSNSASPFTVTSYNSVIYYRSDITAACPFTSSQSTSNYRPNTSFTICREAFNPTFTWSPSFGLSNDTMVNPVASPSTPTTYIISMNNGTCITQDSVYIGLSSSLELSDSATASSCGQSDGTATVIIGSGTGPYTYFWSDSSGQVSQTATGLFAGSYSCEVIDSIGCTDSIYIAISDSGGPSLSSLVFGVTCNGMSDGSIMVTAIGSPPFTYLWSDALGQTTQTAIGLMAGLYSVAVSDSNGCISVTIDTIIESSILVSSVTSVNSSCFGICDGLGSIIVSGGSEPYSYSWNNPMLNTTDTVTDLCAGTFYVTVTDGVGCSNVDSVNIVEPPSITTFISSIPATIGNSDGSASVNVSGAISPLTYLWNDPGSQTDSVAVGLSAGLYTVIIIDGNGCSFTDTISVIEITGIWDFDLGVRFEVYPSPTTGMVIFDLELLEVGGITIQVVDMLGELVFETTQSSVQLYKKETDLTSLSDGIYFVRLTTEKGSIKRRIVVTK